MRQHCFALSRCECLGYKWEKSRGVQYQTFFLEGEKLGHCLFHIRSGKCNLDLLVVMEESLVAFLLSLHDIFCSLC